jgi:hypothetical protein
MDIRYDPRVVSDLDLPADLFRAQLVCEALNTCGAYYVRGQAKERLSRYLVYFQRYLLSKPLLPTHIEFAILDTFDNLEELARSAAIASAVKLKSAAPALKVLKSLSYSLAVFFNSCYSLFFFFFSPFFPPILCSVLRCSSQFLSRTYKLFFSFFSFAPLLPQYVQGKNTASALAALKAAATIEILSAGPLFPRFDSLDQVS